MSLSLPVSVSEGLYFRRGFVVYLSIKTIDLLRKYLYNLVRAPSPCLGMSDPREVVQAADDSKVRMVVCQVPSETIP